MEISSNALQTTNSIDWSSWVNPYHNLEARITLIAREKISKLEKSQIEDLCQGLRLTHKWTFPAGRMKQLLTSIPKETLQVFMLELMANKSEKEIAYYFDKTLKILSEISLLEMAGFQGANFGNDLFKSRGLTKTTALGNNLEKESLAIIKEFLVELKYFCHQMLEILITLTGINKLTRKKENKFGHYKEKISSYEAESKLKMYWKLLAWPATLFGIIYSYIQFTPAAALLTTVSIGAGLTALVAYNRYWKPCPIDHPALKNLSIDMLRQNNPIYPRRDILRKIEAAFQSKKGVILVGEPGCGKSWIARSFVEQAMAGKICKFIQNPQVFTCNGTSLTYYDLFSSIEEKFVGHNDKVVFFFDEFHSIFKKGPLGASPAVEEIKTFCEDFKYVIGATTTKEYNEFIKDETAIVDRRFEVIHVGSMTDLQIKTTLSQYLASINSKIFFDPDVIDYIVSKAEIFNSKTSPIDAARSLLNSAIHKMDSQGDNVLEESIVELEDSIGVISQELISGVSKDMIKELTLSLDMKKNDLVIKQNQLNDKLKEVERMQKMESYRLKLIRQSYQLAEPGKSLVKGSSLERKWVELHAQINLVEEFISKERIRLGLPPCLNKQLIDSILNERSKKDT